MTCREWRASSALRLATALTFTTVSGLGCSPVRPAHRAPVREECAAIPACGCGSWIDALRDRPITLRVYIADRVPRPAACDASEIAVVEVSLDGAALGSVELPCADEGRARIYPVTGPTVTPGLHELSVRVRGARGASERAAMMSLPAFDVLSDGRAALGAEVVIEAGADDVVILPPQVYPPRAR